MNFLNNQLQVLMKLARIYTRTTDDDEINVKDPYTDRKIAAVERMDDERLVPNVDDPADPVAGVESGRGPWIILHGPVIVAVLDILRN